MSPHEKAAIRRAVADNPARDHADIARLFGVRTWDVTKLVYQSLSDREQAEYRRCRNERQAS